MMPLQLYRMSIIAIVMDQPKVLIGDVSDTMWDMHITAIVMDRFASYVQRRGDISMNVKWLGESDILIEVILKIWLLLFFILVSAEYHKGTCHLLD